LSPPIGSRGWVNVIGNSLGTIIVAQRENAFDCN
jgi:Na+/H+-dicarboxylate symporter